MPKDINKTKKSVRYALPDEEEDTKRVIKKKPMGGALPKGEDDADSLSDDDIIENTLDEEIEKTEEEIAEVEIDEVDDDDDLGDGGDEIEDEDETIEEKEDEEYPDEDGNGDGNKAVADDDGECLYEFSKNKQYQDDTDDNYFFEEDKISSEIYVADEDRICKPIMTKYERVRLLCDRTKQLQLRAKPMIKNVAGMTSKEIAEMELRLGKMPLKLERRLPNGQIERWRIDELSIVN